MPYIVFEGIDGSGKSTAARFLAGYLRERGLEPVVLVEPSDGVHGQEIRRRARHGPPMNLEDELALFLADRREQIDAKVRPALARGAFVVQDRSFYSTVAYQGARSGAPGLQALLDLHAFAPRPDIAFLLDLHADAAVDRILRRRKTDAFEERSFLRQVRQNYLNLLHHPVEGRPFYAIDALRSETAIAFEIRDAILPLLERTVS